MKKVFSLTSNQWNGSENNEIFSSVCVGLARSEGIMFGFVLTLKETIKIVGHRTTNSGGCIHYADFSGNNLIICIRSLKNYTFCSVITFLQIYPKKK